MGGPGGPPDPTEEALGDHRDRIAEKARRELGPRIAGPLIAPQDDGYDEARAVYNAMIDRRPALHRALRRSADDVAAAIAFARRHAARSSPCAAGATTGRGWGVVDDGLVIDLSPMREHPG